MKTKALISIIVITTILLCLPSCFTNQKIKAYDDPEKDKTSLAIVQGVNYPPKIGEFTKIIQIDDTPFKRETPFIDGKYRFMILPGLHTIDIIHYQRDHKIIWFIGRYLVSFNAEAGKTYIIHTDTNPETSVVDVYVTDEDTGERIESTVDYKFKFKEKE